jgi:hypothetical protein
MQNEPTTKKKTSIFKPIIQFLEFINLKNMIDSKLIKILSKVYKYDNESYNFKKDINLYKLPNKFKEKDLLLIENSRFEINRIEHYEHNSVIKELKKIITENDLETIVYNLFLRAIGTGFHRGLQPIMSYLFAIQVPEHDFEPFKDRHFRNICKVCGLPKESWENDGKNLYNLYIGYCPMFGSLESLLDLKEVAAFENIRATDDDINIFKKLITTIDNAVEKETPTDLKNRISREKILPNSNNVSRTWLIKIFAELGIMKNTFDENYSSINRFFPYYQKLEWELKLHEKAPNHRVEIDFPISAWRGKLGINYSIVEQILTKLE